MKGLRRGEVITLVAVTLVSVAAGVLHYQGAPDVLSFSIATLALGGLAWTITFATEQVGERFGASVTGVMQSTLGNLPEFFVVLFALQEGLVVVAKFSIVGSILANALLVLGFTILAGAWRGEGRMMRFHAKLPNDTAILLMVAVFIIVLIGISVAAHDPASKHVNEISVVGALCLLMVYGTWIVAYLRSDEEPFHGSPRLSLAGGLVLLAISGVAAAFVSEWFVAELKPTIDRLGISQAFAGLVIVAIAANAVEHGAGVALAWKRRNDLAISIVKNSVAQVAVFLYPALVLASLPFSETLNFSLEPYLIGALFLTAIAVWQVTGDGEATLWEGVALIALYIILGTVTLYE